MAEDQKPAAGKSAGPTMEQRIADLESQLAQTKAGLPGTTIPEHGAGPGLEVWETWSQGDQDAAKAGEFDNIDEEGPPVEPPPAKR